MNLDNNIGFFLPCSHPHSTGIIDQILGSVQVAKGVHTLASPSRVAVLYFAKRKHPSADDFSAQRIITPCVAIHRDLSLLATVSLAASSAPHILISHGRIRAHLVSPPPSALCYGAQNVTQWCTLLWLESRLYVSRRTWW